MNPAALISLDNQALALLNAWRQPWLDLIFSLLTWLGSLWLLLPVALSHAAWRWRQASRRQALLPLAALIGASLSVMALKAMVLRPRPELFTSPLMLPADASFPSGHAAQAAAFAFAYWWQASAAQRAMLVSLVLLVAISRLYLQVHFPSDVFAGLILGSAWAIALKRLLIPVK